MGYRRDKLQTSKNIVYDIRDAATISAEATVDALEQSVIAYATEMRGWYLHNKRAKRGLSKSLRFASLALLISGGLYPVLLHIVDYDATIGYALLASSAGLYLFDRMFGVSSAWMRYMSAAQSLDRAIFDYDRRRSTAMESTQTIPLGLRLQAVSQLGQSVFEIVDSESREWRLTFEDALAELETLVRSDKSPSEKP